MKKLIFVLMMFLGANALLFSQTSEVNQSKNNSVESKEQLSIKGNALKEQNISERKNMLNDNAQSLMTIEQVIQEAREGIDFIGNDELIQRINANPKLILIDVRTKDEYDAGHLKGATWLERGIAEFTLARTIRDPEAEIITYCLKGNRSALVVKKLKQMGYKNVKTHVGLEDWVKANLPIYNYLGEIKIVELRKLNAASFPVEYYLDKK